MNLARTYQGKVVVVTGGTSGIGKELVLQLSAYGAQVYFSGRNSAAAESVIDATANRAVFIEADIQKAADVESLFETVLRSSEHIDYVLHCAGVILGGEIRDHQLADIENILHTNVMGTAYVAHRAYQIMVRQGYGHLVNVSSGAGLFPLPLMGVYSSSKFFVYGLSEVLRMEGKGLGVKVSTVAPGIVDTPIYDRGRYSKTDKGTTIKLFKSRLWTMQADKAAHRILKGVARNRTVIHTQLYVRSSWLSYRLFPHIFRFVVTRLMGPYRKRLRANDGN